jgi:prophage regulatory protein
MSEALLRLPDVIARTGLSRAAIYAAIARGEFPESVPISARARAWPSSRVESWVQAKIAAAQKLSGGAA